MYLNFAIIEATKRGRYMRTPVSMKYGSQQIFISNTQTSKEIKIKYLTHISPVT